MKKLNSGYEIPVIGLGTWTLRGKTAEDCVYYAIKCGYRLIDTAEYYGNEIEVGRGIRRAIDEGIATREEIFITTKLLPMNYTSAIKAIEQSNRDLGLDYIDLMLIHQQGSKDVETYSALEKAVETGIVKSIGISNYYTAKDVDRIVSAAKIFPAVIQNENHPLYQNQTLQNYVAKYGTIIESYYPLGGRGNTKKLFNVDVIQKLANKHKKTPAQIILHWHIQSNYITIPGSANMNHIAENLSIFDFELTDEEMNQISALNTGSRFENW